MIPSLALVCRLVFVFAVLTVLACSPARAQQQPRFTEIQRDGRISWTSETNVSYTLQKTVQLGSGIWTDVATVPGNGGSVSTADFAQTNAQAFYRVVAANSAACTNAGGGSYLTAAFLGPAFPGDTSPCRAGPITTGCGNGWFRITVREDNSSIFPVDLRLDVALDSPAGANYNLYLYGPNAVSLRSSALAAGQRDSVFFEWDDNSGADDTRDFWIEVRQAAGSPSGTWTLRTSGGAGPCY